MPTAKGYSRHRVVAFLEKGQTASASEIARALKTSPANIRHHLAVLQADGLVEMTGSRAAQGRGRPVKLYGLSETVLGNNLASLSSAVLRAWLSGSEPADLPSRLRSLAREMLGAADTSGPVARRLATTVERLNGWHYQARWEAHASGPAIFFGHCPFAAIIAQHPELCGLDALILEEQLGLPVTQTAKLEMGAAGRPFCRFVIR